MAKIAYTDLFSGETIIAEEPDDPQRDRKNRPAEKELISCQYCANRFFSNYCKLTGKRKDSPATRIRYTWTCDSCTQYRGNQLIGRAGKE